MAELLWAILDSPNGVTAAEQGLLPVQLAAGPGPANRSPAARASAAIFNTERPTDADRLFHHELRGGAEIGGAVLPQASQYMLHYLTRGGNAGLDDAGNPTPEPVELIVKVKLMRKEIPGFGDDVDATRLALEDDLKGRLEAGDRPVRLASRPIGYGALSGDWFYALGRFHYVVWCDVTYRPGLYEALADFRVEVTDFYDWDRDKVTLPFTDNAGNEIVVEDEQLRRLHRVGLAREYPVRGRDWLRRKRFPLPRVFGGGTRR